MQGESGVLKLPIETESTIIIAEMNHKERLSTFSKHFKETN